MTDESQSDRAPDDSASLESNSLTRERLAKYRKVMEDGGFPYSFSRTDTTADLKDRFPDLEPGASTGEIVTVAGRLMNTREMGKLIFAVVLDGWGSIQLFVDKRTLGGDTFDAFRDLDGGDWIGATGEVIVTERGELSVKIFEFTLLQKSLRPLPDKWHGLKDVEQRSRRRYLDLLANEDSRRVALTRAKIVSELRTQFESRGYIEVETPVLVGEATGATARPFKTRHNALDMEMQLRIATELFLKRLVIGGIERVFEIGRIFRNEGIDSTHNPEFTMLESYEAFADFQDVMVLVEEVVAACAIVATGGSEITYDGRQIDLAGPYRRATMLELTQEAVGEDMSYDTPVADLRVLARRHGIDPENHWGSGKLIEALFDRLVEETLWEPTFVTEHPIETSPLARAHREKPHVTERFELIIAGDEYANAFSELNDPFDQRARFEAQAAAKAAGDEEAHPIDEDYIRALEYGLPPTGGLGIGVDRLVMLLTDKHHIREVILFPTMRPEPKEES
ncbi:MAG: lysine--tRNA ligase [Actinomycetota bacterium]|nr:lysine--tRNA ligase [Actinomycetota bacterium]MDK1016374.1 lysine--tRNA ligase [Actinomycetota bacterium]MDK1026136.1 lysine--tRNA ligase [Actinomycetota bacterium]MDK1037740.1 lysine--tRNA ligase [Actinomycetota bacterium]MDK1095977.1 lysine--tRNA ligase [Actinomycetota bacterium]